MASSKVSLIQTPTPQSGSLPSAKISRIYIYTYIYIHTYIHTYTKLLKTPSYIHFIWSIFCPAFLILPSPPRVLWRRCRAAIACSIPSFSWKPVPWLPTLQLGRRATDFWRPLCSPFRSNTVHQTLAHLKVLNASPIMNGSFQVLLYLWVDSQVKLDGLEKSL